MKDQENIKKRKACLHKVMMTTFTNGLETTQWVVFEIYKAYNFVNCEIMKLVKFPLWLLL